MMITAHEVRILSQKHVLSSVWQRFSAEMIIDLSCTREKSSLESRDQNNSRVRTTKKEEELSILY